jgi:hypothetical protein
VAVTWNEWDKASILRCFKLKRVDKVTRRDISMELQMKRVVPISAACRVTRTGAQIPCLTCKCIVMKSEPSSTSTLMSFRKTVGITSRRLNSGQ